MRYKIENKLSKTSMGGKGLKLFNFIKDTYNGEIIEGLGDACKLLNAQDAQIEELTAALREVNLGANAKQKETQ